VRVDDIFWLIFAFLVSFFLTNSSLACNQFLWGSSTTLIVNDLATLRF